MTETEADARRIAMVHVIFSGDYDDLTAEQARAKVEELAADMIASQAVTPLQPGERVTIPDGMCDRDVLRVDNGVYREYGRPKYLFLTPELDGDTEGQIALDAAGVAALIEACQRWQAAQED